MSDVRASPATPLPIQLPGLFTADECRALCDEIDASQQERAQVWLGDRFAVDAGSRRGTIADLGGAAEDFVLDRVLEVVPRLAADLGAEVAELSDVTALVYRTGDHFAAHSDGGDDPDRHDEVGRRRISLVVALNDGAGEHADFSGGELLFLPEPAGVAPAVLTVHSRAGLLVAFPSPLRHQVLPVRSGIRRSLALWALAADPRPPRTRATDATASRGTPADRRDRGS